jgi:diacylglycerol kinase
MIKSIKRAIGGIRYALEGWSFALRNDQHFRVNLTLSLLGTVLSLLFLSGCRALLVALINYLILVVELINTAIEKAVDTATDEFHPMAKAAKDVASSAVLTIGLFAIIVDIIFLLPVIIEKL